MESLVVGYLASSTSIIAFGSQFYHTIKTKTTAGLSLNRSIFDTISLVLWVYYAARLEDIPLLIATACELLTSIGVIVLIYKNRKHVFLSVKDYTPPPSPPQQQSPHSDTIIIEVKPESQRRNSV